MSNSSEDKEIDVRLDSIRTKNRITLGVSDTEIMNSYAFIYIFSSITNVNKTISLDCENNIDWSRRVFLYLAFKFEN